jgi:hypothetical protein
LNDGYIGYFTILLYVKKRRMRWAGYVAYIGKMKNAYRILMGKSKEKRPLGRPRHRWYNNIAMDLRKIEWRGMDWIYLAQDRDPWRALVNMAMNLRIP